MSNRVTPADLAKVASLFATAVIMLLANGLQGTLVPVRASAEGFSGAEIAFMGSAYFTGFVAGCWYCPRLTARAGHIRTFAVLGAVTAAIILIHALLISPLAWALMRAGIGFCAAGIFALLEGWINQKTANTIRGRIFTIYATLNNLALLGGQYLFTLASPSSFELFSVTAILTMLCLVPVGLTSQPEPARSHATRIRLLSLYVISPVAVTGALIVGLVSGAFWTMAPVFAHSRGLNGDGIALFMSAVILGGALAQWPLGRLSDFTDRRHVIGACSAVAALAGIMLAMQAPFGISPLIWLLASGALYGATAFPIGSLTNAHLNDHARQDQMTEIASSNLFVYGVAAALGPAIAAAIIHVAGMSAIFIYTATIHAGFVAFVAWRMLRRAPVAKKDREPFEVEPLQPAPMHMSSSNT